MRGVEKKKYIYIPKSKKLHVQKKKNQINKNLCVKRKKRSYISLIFVPKFVEFCKINSDSSLSMKTLLAKG